MFYNRAKAMEFAADFWDRPCRSDKHDMALGLDSARDVPVTAVWDQRKAPASQYELRFVFNELMNRDDLVAVPKAGATSGLPKVVIVEGKKLEDCAHFLSQCLKAGDLRIAEQWSVPMLVSALRQGEDTSTIPFVKTLAEKVPRAAAQAVIHAGLLRIGDMIGYFTKGNYSHSAMYTGVYQGVGRVTCHTRSRFMGKTPKGGIDAWYLVNPNYLFTLLHIAYRTPPPMGQTLAGWWTVTGTGLTEHWHLTADGRAMRTRNAPQGPKPRVAADPTDSRGYWFEEHGRLQLVWRKDGALADMRLSADATSARGVAERVLAVARKG